MAIQGKLMTADELWVLPDDGQGHELVRGELRTMAPPGQEHGRITMTLGAPLDQYVTANRLGYVYGEFGCRIEVDPDTVLAPDIASIQ
jgi:Uma2 family endonuclease